MSSEEGGKKEEEEMSEEHFRKGKWVEVTSDEEGFRGGWFVAKVIKLPLGSNDDAASSKTKIMQQRRKDEFLVEYKSIMEEEQGTKPLSEYVHTSCIRPLPLKEPTRLFEVNELVDAFDRDGWWEGVITQVFDKESKCNVYFESTKEELEFLQSNLRVHFDWIDGQWSKPGKQQQQQQQQQQHKMIKQDDDAQGSKKKNVKKRGRPSKEKSHEQGKDTGDKQRSIRSSKKKRKNIGSGLEALGILSNTADEYQSPPIIDNKGSKLASKSNNSATEEDPSTGTEIASDTADEHQSSPMIDNKATEEDLSCRTEILRDTADEHSSPMIDKKEISPDKLSQSNEVATKEDTLLKDLEIPESFNLTKSPEEEDTCIIGNQCNEATKEQNEMGPASVDNQCKDSRTVEKEVTLASVCNRCDEASAKQNQMKESFVNHETRKECDEVHLEAPVIDSTNDKLSVETESLPFVKTSVMWETILAMQIFHKMPQRPHFHPLKQYNMVQREGMAIGHMATFAYVVKKTEASHIDDPRSNLEEVSKALVDLEAHGFNVQAIQSRVQRLLELKDKQLMLEKKSKEAKVKIIELKNEKDKCKTQLDKVKENLRFHKEAASRLKSEDEVLIQKMDKIESDISLMELDAKADNSKSVNLEYPSVAAGLQ